MNEQLRLLRELQDVDFELKGIEVDKERYPREIENLDEQLTSEKEMFKKNGERIELLEKERRPAFLFQKLDSLPILLEHLFFRGQLFIQVLYLSRIALFVDLNPLELEIDVLQFPQ